MSTDIDIRNVNGLVQLKMTCPTTPPVYIQFDKEEALTVAHWLRAYAEQLPAATSSPCPE